MERARQNLHWLLVVAALQALGLATLLGAGATGWLAPSAMGLTVTAEISVSLLFTTAWQPLLATRANAEDRQPLNTLWSAVAEVSSPLRSSWSRRSARWVANVPA